uniref:MADF domain-containing protein n=2 Tax=Anopheles atroparvus TaxID=41427 RepID=A0AAG5CNU2_ANOAO
MMNENNEKIMGGGEFSGRKRVSMDEKQHTNNCLIVGTCGCDSSTQIAFRTESRILRAATSKDVTVEMTNEACLTFISKVQGHGCLWNRKNEGYKNVLSQRDAWKALEAELKLPYELLRQKWKSLQSSYRHYSKKYEASLRTGSATDDIAYPTWYAYEAMSFLSASYHPGSSFDSLKLFEPTAPSTVTREPSPPPVPLTRTPSPQPGPSTRTPSSQPGPSTRAPSPQPGPSTRAPSPQPGPSTRTPSSQPGPSTRALSPQPRPQSTHAPTLLTTPPGQRSRGAKRRWDEANLRYNENVLRALEKVSATSDRLMEERRTAQTDGAVFSQWVGGMLDEWSPQRRHAVKVAIRQIICKADAARFRERMGMNPEDLFEDDEDEDD